MSSLAKLLHVFFEKKRTRLKKCTRTVGDFCQSQKKKTKKTKRQVKQSKELKIEKTFRGKRKTQLRVCSIRFVIKKKQNKFLYSLSLSNF